MVELYASENTATEGIRAVKSRQRGIQEFFQVVVVEEEQPFLIKEKHYIDEYGWSEPGDSPVGLEDYAYTAEELDDQSCGNYVVDRRACMDSDALLQDLKMRSKERMLKEAGWKSSLDDKPDAVEARPMSIWDKDDEESDDSEEDAGLRDLDQSFESVSGSDSEYWAAMEDEALSDATVRSTEESSSQDFQ